MKKLICLTLVLLSLPHISASAATDDSYIKWIDFTPTYSAMSDALEADIAAHAEGRSLSWVDILAYHAAKNGGNFSSYKAADTAKLASLMSDGSDITEHVGNTKLFNYYRRAYGAVLGGLVGEYTQVCISDDGSETRQAAYGLRGYSPIAAGYYYADFDDFGASRSYGYRRRHLGHDLMGSVGTPVIAVESGYAEAVGWNQYGGWRIGIRSDDRLRYYYYAHLRKDNPYAPGLAEGQHVSAGDVIGFMGRTGYSHKENVNNIETVHLHFGMELVFDESQKECNSEIWIDVYNIVRLLSSHRSSVYYNKESGRWERLYPFRDLDAD